MRSKQTNSASPVAANKQYAHVSAACDAAASLLVYIPRLVHFFRCSPSKMVVITYRTLGKRKPVLSPKLLTSDRPGFAVCVPLVHPAEGDKGSVSKKSCVIHIHTL